MAFPQSFLDEIRARVSLSQLVGRRVQLKQKGRGDWWGNSPFTNEKTPSFHVVDDKGFYHCFSTGEHGDHFSWLMQVEGQSFPEAVEILAGLAGLEVPKSSPEERQREERRKDLGDVIAFARDWYTRQLESPAGKEARTYLQGRGLEAMTIEAFQLGFAPDDKDALATAAKEQGIEMAQLLEAGLYRAPDDGRAPYPLFRNRIMFPINDRRGRPIAFGGRFMGDAKAIGVGKYINSPETPLFDKSRTLYNLDRAREPTRGGERLLVVEGYMDVIGLWQAGFPATVAPLGTAITEQQINELWRYADEPTLCLDGDAAGRNAALKAAIRALPKLMPKKTLSFTFLPDGEDPDSLVRNSGPTAFAAKLEERMSLDRFLFQAEINAEKVDTPEQRANFELRLEDIANAIDNPHVKIQYRKVFKEYSYDYFYNLKKRKSNSSISKMMRELQREMNRFMSSNTPYSKERFSKILIPQAQILKRRTQQILVACFINHPETIDLFGEQTKEIIFDADLDSLRIKTFSIFFQNPRITGGEMRETILSINEFDLLSKVLNQKVYNLAKQCRPSSAASDVIELMEEIFTIQEENKIRFEIQATNMRNKAEARRKLQAGENKVLQPGEQEELAESIVIGWVRAFQFSSGNFDQQRMYA